MATSGSWFERTSHPSRAMCDNLFHIGYRSLARIKEQGDGVYDMRPEDQLTAYFGSMLRIDPDMQRAFCRHVLGSEPEGAMEVRTQTSVPGIGQPDMMLRCGSTFVLCENKLGRNADLSERQVAEYSKFVEDRIKDGEDWRLMVISDFRPRRIEQWSANPKQYYLRPKDGRDHFGWDDIFRMVPRSDSATDSVLGSLREQFLEHLDLIGLSPQVYLPGGNRTRLVSEDVVLAKEAWRRLAHVPFGNEAAPLLEEFGLRVGGTAGGRGPQLLLNPVKGGCFEALSGKDVRLLPSPPGRGKGLFEFRFRFGDADKARVVALRLNGWNTEGRLVSADHLDDGKSHFSVATMRLADVIGTDTIHGEADGGDESEIRRMYCRTVSAVLRQALANTGTTA